MLLDTHALLWFLMDDPRLPAATKKIIAEADAPCFVSVASLWEVAIKYQLGRFDLHLPSLEMLFELIPASGIGLLPLSTQHILQLGQLPLHHHDPFDRILIAQAQVESFRLVSKDAAFSAYAVNLFWEK